MDQTSQSNSRYGSVQCVLLDHLVGAQQDRFGDRNAQGLGGLEVDDQLEFGWLLDGQVGRFRAPEDLVDIRGGTCQEIRRVRVTPSGHRSRPVPCKGTAPASCAGQRVRLIAYAEQRKCFRPS